MPEKIVTKFLRLPNFRVIQTEFDEGSGEVSLSVERRGVRPVRFCSACGTGTTETYGEPTEATYRDLPWGEWKVLVCVDKYRIRCPRCRKVKTERLSFADPRSHLTIRYETWVASDSRHMPLSKVAERHALHWETVKLIDRKHLRLWAELRKRRPLRYIGIDEKSVKKGHHYLTIVSDLERREVIWIGEGRDEAAINPFFAVHLTPRRCRWIRAVCIDMARAYANSVRRYCKNARIVYDKFHVLRLAGEAIDEVRRSEFFRLGGKRREIIKGKRWLFLRRWVHLAPDQKRAMTDLFRINRRLSKAYWLRETLSKLWQYTYRASAYGFFTQWLHSLKWQRLNPFVKFARTLGRHIDGVLNYCDEKVPFGVVEALNRTIDDLFRRARGYRDREYLRLKIMFTTAHPESPV